MWSLFQSVNDKKKPVDILILKKFELKQNEKKKQTVE